MIQTHAPNMNRRFHRRDFTAEPRTKRVPQAVLQAMPSYVDVVKAFAAPAGAAAPTPAIFHAALPADGTNYTDRSSLLLFAATGPSMHDVHQGYTSERCWHISNRASMALNMPLQLQAGIVQESPGNYRVRFVTNGVDEWDYVNAQIPDNGEQVWDGCIWVNIDEKAFARRRTGANTYASLQMGTQYESLIDLGFTARNYSPTDPAAWTAVALALNAGLPAGFGTIAIVPASSPLANAHCYSIVSYDPVTKMVTIYNPWGITGPLNDGTMTLPLAQVQAAAGVITVGLSYTPPQNFASQSLPTTPVTTPTGGFAVLPLVPLDMSTASLSQCKLETQGGLADIGWQPASAGAYAEFSVTIPTAGTYALIVDYSALAQSATAITVDGVAEGIVPLGATGSWATIASFAASMPLTAGAHKIRLTGTTVNQYNLFRLRLVRIA